MKNYFLALSALVTLTLATSCNSNVETSVKGVVVDASMNSISIAEALSGDTICFSITDSKITSTNGILLGDTAEVFHKIDIIEITPATRVIITPAPRPTILGGWVEPIPGIGGEQGVFFEKEGVASSINMSTLVYKSWMQNGDTLILTGESIGNGQTIQFTEKAVIEKLDADSLIINIDNNRIARYSKQK